VDYLPIKSGTRGAVLDVYDADSQAYDVEFFGEEVEFFEGIPCPKSFGVFTVLGSDLELLVRQAQNDGPL
jgi:hypothetical protein